MADVYADEETPIGRMYLRLFQLEHEHEPSILLQEVLDLLIAEASAQLAYVELRSLDEQGLRSTYTSAAPFRAQEIRSRLSTSVLERVIETGKSYTGNVASDARFSDVGSVRRNEIEHVLVVAVGDRQPPHGAVYLQAQPGREFDAATRTRVEILAQRLASPLGWRLLGARRSWREVTASLQRGHVLDVLERCGGNKSAVARELGITRQRVYQLLAELGISTKR
jgi:transcriptional regulator with GAF, ATPase, and Fis domain